MHFVMTLRPETLSRASFSARRGHDQDKRRRNPGGRSRQLERQKVALR